LSGFWGSLVLIKRKNKPKQWGGKKLRKKGTGGGGSSREDWNLTSSSRKEIANRGTEKRVRGPRKQHSCSNGGPPGLAVGIKRCFLGITQNHSELCKRTGWGRVRVLGREWGLLKFGLKHSRKTLNWSKKKRMQTMNS